MPLFRRDYQLIIGRQGETQGSLIRDLELEFKITKSSDDAQNKAEIEIYNLSPETLAKFDTSEDDDTNNPVVILQTKYLDDTGDTFHTLYTGNVADIFTSKKGPDLITKLTCSDGYVPIREARISRNFPSSTTRRTVLKALTDALGVPIGEIRDGGSLDQTFENGTTFEGSVKLALDRLLDAVNIEWSIQDDSFHAVRRDLASLESVLDLHSGYDGSVNTGLIGSPQRTKGRKNRTTGQENELSEGVTVQTLLEPGLRPNRRVRVTSKGFPDGQLFKVVKVVHEGDFRGKKWFSKADLLAYNISL